MTKVYVIRHAEAEGNLYRIAQGQSNSLITARGLRQVDALKRRFADIPVDAVYASDLYRTCVTAGAIYQPKGLPLHRRRDLREISVGVWEQKTWGEIVREDPEEMKHFLCRLDLWHIPGGETPEQVRDRVLGAVREIAKENVGKTVAVFSHGCAIQILLATLQGYSIAELGKTGHGDNTAVSLIEVEGDTWRVVFRDDNSHLTDPRYTGGEEIQQRAGALDPGLYFAQLRLPEQNAFFTQCVASAWRDAGEQRSWDGRELLETARRRPTLVGYLQDKAVGVVQFHPEKEAAANCGWISLHCVEKALRNRGFGIQLLGQAVQFFRPLGRSRLRLGLGENNVSARRYFMEYGFVPVGKTASGKEILELDIGYKPEFLGESGASADFPQVCR